MYIAHVANAGSFLTVNRGIYPSCEASSSEQTNLASTPSSTINPPVSLPPSSSEVNVSTDKGDWWCDLHRCDLLLQLIEALEKCMYNAYEGAALSLPQLPK
ncbi:unnamed protein product, partial [Rotaria magnacalcarata]